MKQIRKRLTYANVMSSLAVFLILGGATAFAAVKKVGPNEIKANSIKTGKIIKEAVTSGKIKKGAVTEVRLADGAVTTPKIASDAVTGEKVNESTLGEVPNAAKLGGLPPSSYQETGDLLFATVAPANAAAAIVRGRGAASVTRVVEGSYIVTFERDVTACTWVATYGQPNNAFVDARWATVRGREAPNQVGVVLRDAAGAQVDGVGFHVAVICP